ncbi:GmrSD restriction endonuclease domain-containing protein [Falsiroseomonas sp. CW058]|uniref:GmrSD restriction endonuclease domain-containing protein n=1 Tax=Falsiroseomonas sp. CW058 TaxID=3388664 RepID=UPI003D31F8ED
MPWATSAEQKINSQEHILPQAHRDGGWWQAHWPDEANADRFKYRLGNLVLTADNNALGRKPIMEKLNGPGAHYFNAINATNSEKRVRLFTDGTSWLSQQVLQREFELLDFAARRWSLPCCFDNGIISLPADFVDENNSVRTITISETSCVGQSDSEVADDTDSEDN